MLLRVVWPQHSTGEGNKRKGMRSAQVAQLPVAVCTERSMPHVCVHACIFNRSAAMTQVRIGRFARKLS